MTEAPDYARQIETYLCQKNEGHLIRVVGPAFEMVCEWAERGVPLRVAFRGIDRYFERYYAKGPRRRPVRIEFCEADVLDAFDEWRRAVGVTASGALQEAVTEAAPRKPALAAHMERAVARLTALRAGGRRSVDFAACVDTAVREMDRLLGDARHARGEARAAIVERLAAIDRELLAAAGAEIDPATAARLRREAEEELAPFGSRIAPEARERATASAFERLIRETVGLPLIAYE